MKIIRLKRQPKWIVRVVFRIWTIVGLVLALYIYQIRWTNAQSEPGASNTSSYIHEQLDESGVNTLTICDWDDSSKCITIKDRNEWANTSDITNTGSYWYHYQRWNNYPFVHPWVNWQDAITQSATTGRATWSISYRNHWYNWPITNFMKWGQGYWIKNEYHKDVWWWSGDSKSNDWWLNLNNPEDRKWPCDTWYHVPSMWEWNQLLKYWAEENEIKFNDGYRLTLLEWYKFQKDFKIPFAGYRDGDNAKVNFVGDEADLWSSSPADYVMASRFHLSPNEVSTRYSNSPTDGFSVRCFKDSPLSFSSGVTVKVVNGKDVLYRWEMVPGSKISDNVDVMAILNQDKIKNGYAFLWWYDEDGEEIDLGTVPTKNTKIIAKWRGYIHEKEVDEINILTICDWYDSSKCITMKDRNEWATIAGIECSEINSGACGYHFQWWNNHWFAPCLDSNECNAFPNGETKDRHRVDCEWYGPTTPFEDSIFRAIWDNDYCLSWNDNMWWWSWDSQENDRGYPLTLEQAESRKWPCDTWYHVPSIWEWNQLLKYWAEENEINFENYIVPRGWYNTLKWLYDDNYVLWLKFQEDFKVPFAGLRVPYAIAGYSDSNARVSVGGWADLWSSSPYWYYGRARVFGLSPDLVSADRVNDRSYAFSVRCFKDSSLSSSSSVAVKVINEKDILFRWEIVPGSKISDNVDVMAILNQDMTKNGYIFLWWYDEYGEEIDLNLILTKNTKIFAKWSVDYIYEKKVKWINTLTICDPMDEDNCVTMKDRNQWATKAGTWCSESDIGACGFHFQWWNNHWFAPNFDWSDEFPNGEAIDFDQIDCGPYSPFMPLDSSTFIVDWYDYCLEQNDNMWWWNWDSEDNDRWYPLTLVQAENRRWPCDTWYHIPSIWEWENLLRIWMSMYTWRYDSEAYYEVGEFWSYAYDNYNVLWYKFQEDFKIPFAGYRDYDAYVFDVGDYTSFWSSSPDASFYLNSYELWWVIGDNYNYRANAGTVRCFKDIPLRLPFSVVVKVMDGEYVLWEWEIDTQQILPEDVIALMSRHMRTKVGYTFSGWYDDESDSWRNPENIVETWFTLRAVWIANDYSISFVDPNWWNILNVWTWKYGTQTNWVVSYPNWTRNGYTLSWSGEIPATVPAENTVITAIWTEEPTENPIETPTETPAETPTEAPTETPTETPTVNNYTVTIAINNTNSWTVNQRSVTVLSWTLVTINGNKVKIGTTEVTATPKNQTAQWTYQFVDWTNTCGNTISVWCTITANFKSTLRSYTIIWKDGDWVVVERDNNVPYWATPTYNWSTPTKTDTKQYTYTFSTWSPVISEVRGNQEYIAQFNSERKDSWEDVASHHSVDEIQYDASKYDSSYSYEMNQAYQYSYHYEITSKESISKADMTWKLTRIATAKMLSQYAINVLWMTPDTTKQVPFTDVSAKLDADYDNGVTLAYQLWIMWINMPNNEFRPYDTVSRAEFVTAFSRMRYGILDGKDVYYSTHMKLLYDLWIISNTNPSMKEIRWYVMLILMRSDKNN